MSNDIEQDLIQRLYEGKESFEQIAKSITREREIACLESRIDECFSYCKDGLWKDRVKELQLKLAELKGRK